MANDDDDAHDTIHNDDQAAYVFQLDSEPPATPAREQPRPKKRRRTAGRRLASSPEPEPNAPLSDQIRATDGWGPEPACARYFVPLFNGAEDAACVRKRAQAYDRSWKRTQTAVDGVLFRANEQTLAQVAKFVSNQEQDGDDAAAWRGERIPAAFINTGPNVSSQDLLFDQLADHLRSVDGGGNRVVRLKAADAGGTLKAILKKIVKEGISRAAAAAVDGEGGDGDDGLDGVREETRVVGGRKYLEYDLEALAAVVDAHRCRHVFVAFQDSEAFDGGLLSDLIHLFSTWKAEIPFTLLFGIATSVELLQARLLKSTVPQLHGAQFDVVQATTVIQQLFKHAVANMDVGVRLGPSLLRTLLDRQRDQVAGVQAFISSLRYAYMCHFYANPLSVLLGAEDEEGVEGLEGLVQQQHVDAARTLPSFREVVESEVEDGQLDRARSLLLRDDVLSTELRSVSKRKREWTRQLLRCLHLLRAIRPYAYDGDYSEAYIAAMEDGIDPEADETLVRDPIRRMNIEDVIALVERVLEAIEQGDDDVNLAGWASDVPDFRTAIQDLGHQATELRKEARENKHQLRSKYTSQGKRMRATVVAQRVQLTSHEATLTDQDKAFTALVDGLVALLAQHTRCVPVTTVFLHEAWVYDSRAPVRDVFVPRARATIERSLRRPHDYLGCVCCGDGGDGDGGLKASLPATALLYRLYMETGHLINVADLWTAFFSVVGEDGEEEREGLDEKTALVRFYQGLAELKALGFVKASKRKTDHIAKLKWL